MHGSFPHQSPCCSGLAVEHPDSSKDAWQRNFIAASESEMITDPASFRLQFRNCTVSLAIVMQVLYRHGSETDLLSISHSFSWVLQEQHPLKEVWFFPRHATARVERCCRFRPSLLGGIWECLITSNATVPLHWLSLIVNRHWSPFIRFVFGITMCFLRNLFFFDSFAVQGFFGPLSIFRSFARWSSSTYSLPQWVHGLGLGTESKICLELSIIEHW